MFVSPKVTVKKIGWCPKVTNEDANIVPIVYPRGILQRVPPLLGSCLDSS